MKSTYHSGTNGTGARSFHTGRLPMKSQGRRGGALLAMARNLAEWCWPTKLRGIRSVSISVSHRRGLSCSFDSSLSGLLFVSRTASFSLLIRTSSVRAETRLVERKKFGEKKLWAIS